MVVMTPKAQALAGPPTGIDWTLTAGTPKLTTRFFSVQVAGVGSGPVRVGAAEGAGRGPGQEKCVSLPVSASYGFEDATGDVQLKVMADRRQGDRTEHRDRDVDAKRSPRRRWASSLLDATTGAELARLDKIEVAISL